MAFHTRPEVLHRSNRVLVAPQQNKQKNVNPDSHENQDFLFSLEIQKVAQPIFSFKQPSIRKKIATVQRRAVSDNNEKRPKDNAVHEDVRRI